MHLALSRQARIKLLLAIDVLFFFTELFVGYAVGSLALVADSFHMLNDVMSLIVALYAIKLTAQTSDTKYTYGWHRAEILAALINGVFLLALCFSIFLEAIGRFFATPEISAPKLVVIVGTLGLASNIVGLFLFHEHGHSHGPSESASSVTSSAGADSMAVSEDAATPISTSRGSQSRKRSDSYSSLYGHPAATRASLVHAAEEIANARSPSPVRQARRGKRSTSRHGVDPELDDTHVGRLSVVQDQSESDHDHNDSTERTPLIANGKGHASEDGRSAHDDEGGHSHAGHSHGGSMNMRALLLHVLGDALGNVGVIAAGLVIWLTDWRFKYEFDPFVSLVITIIIFSSALPLVRSTSYILLQGVPDHVSLEAVRQAIESVPGVHSVHELHIWQLSETKVVASVHVTTSRQHDFMTVAARIRKELHHQGIHSTTIQPEYHPGQVPDEQLAAKGDASCLISCPPDQLCSPTENSCCPPGPSSQQV
ncbi:cation efflux protein [Punctularia strigosozonata HHB-11173 SS5]|uniref:cation efflux protein n=1 Tax=Punctularia strigosozonata (strain HHB-11173) TaxID=741275 RepID=UPI0004417C05|nr:cation efflux protein [Punctularia strigosozonata HHB-11173 SS5]EIN14213.1 cation efflux protein [Punctularia strigosozonata HHB-11173 SS5]